MPNHWRRFLPKRNKPGVVLPDGNRLSTIRSLEDANWFIEQLKAQPEPRDKLQKIDYFHTLLLAQTPRSALAQAQMDSHKHGYHNREKRLYELIDFNDTFVSLVLATPHAELPTVAERLKQDMTAFCDRLNAAMFTDKQYDAIVRGLSREIAVYRSAKYMGFDAQMTSRTEDAFGIDMVITDPSTEKVLNIDCKTPPAFRHRLEDLVHHGRINDNDLLRGDETGFLTVLQHRGQESVPVTLLCILPDILGDIRDFTFVEPERLHDQLNRVFNTLP